MTCARLRNIDRFLDRHGKPRHYYRVGRGPRIRLPGEPGSAEYMAAYDQAVANAVGASKSTPEISSAPTFPGLCQGAAE